jgi:hypothetical protein
VTWITVTASGSGPGSASYKVDGNKTGSSRTGQILLGGNTITITQSKLGNSKK